MNNREKILAAAVAALLLLLGGYFMVSRASALLTARQSRLDALRSELQRQDRVIRRGQRAARELATLRGRSLPADREQAQSLYQRWLLDLVEQIGLTDPSVRTTDVRSRGQYYETVGFQVDGDATLDQMVRFLFQFYSAGDLHRLQSLNIQAIKDSTRLDVSLTVEALILPGSTRTTVGDLKSDRLQAQPLQAFLDPVLQRNLFAPANRLPEIERIGDQEVARGQTLSLSAKATDPDEQRLTWALGNEPPPGASVSADSGAFRWTPKENGKYTVSLQVADDGVPSRSQTATFQVTVVDPADENGEGSQSFDEASHVYMVGAIAAAQRRELWLNARTSGRLLKLAEGETFQIGSTRGEVLKVGDNQAEIRTATGRLRLRIGQNLTQAAVIQEPPLQAASPEAHRDANMSPQ